MSILVTGGAGFIGANFVKYMLKKYIDIDCRNYLNCSYSLDSWIFLCFIQTCFALKKVNICQKFSIIKNVNKLNICPNY